MFSAHPWPAERSGADWGAVQLHPRLPRWGHRGRGDSYHQVTTTKVREKVSKLKDPKSSTHNVFFRLLDNNPLIYCSLFLSSLLRYIHGLQCIDVTDEKPHPFKVLEKQYKVTKKQEQKNNMGYLGKSQIYSWGSVYICRILCSLSAAVLCSWTISFYVSRWTGWRILATMAKPDQTHKT